MSEESDELPIEYWQGLAEEMEKRIADLQDQVLWLRGRLLEAMRAEMKEPPR